MALAGTAAAGLVALHFLHIPASAGQLPGLLRSANVSPWAARLRWLFWAAGLPALGLAFDRWRRSPGPATTQDPLDDRARHPWRAVLVGLALAAAVVPTQYDPAPAISLFEAGHAFAPAWQDVRGEQPYRDFVPEHGWLEDGGFEAVGLRLGVPPANLLPARSAIQATALAVATYGLALAVLESVGWAAAAAGLLLFLANGHPQPRAALPMIGLAVFAFGLRSGRRAILFLGGLVSAASVFSALEFGLYALAAEFGALLALITLARDRRARAGLAWAAAGAVLGALPFAVELQIHGALGPFARESFWRLPHLVDEAYGLPPVDPLAWDPGQWHSPALRHLVDPALASGLLVLAMRRLRKGDGRGAVLVLASGWTLLAYRSVVERRHIFYLAPGVAVLLAYALRACWRALASARWPGMRKAAALLAGALGLAAYASQALWARATARGMAGSYERFFHPAAAAAGAFTLALPVPSRARIPESEGIRLLELRRFLDERLRPGETFVNFTNQAALHYCTGRLNPLPYYEIPLLEDASGQEWAIRRVQERRPPLVLMEWGIPDETAIDGIPNRERAPRLWRYLMQEYPRTIAAAGCLWRARPDTAPGIRSARRVRP